MAITMVEIARHTNLSPATVSRVLNGKGVGFISTATRQKVLEAARELGYASLRLTRDAVSGRTRVMAVWIRNPDRPFYASIVRHLLEAAHKSGYDLLVTPVHDQLPGAQGLSGGGYLHDGSASWPTDGVFAVDCPSIADPHVHRAPAKCPLVGLSSDYPVNADSVGFDAVTGVRQAVEHLISIGCRRIAHVSSLIAIDRVRAARAAAYEEAVRHAGLAPEMILSPDESRASARAVVAEFIRAHGAPDGLFCLNDDLAIGAYRAVRDGGLRIPEDVAIVGCDGIEDGLYLDAPLSSVVHPVGEMCTMAWDIMMRRMEEPSTPIQQVLLKPQLRIDASSRR